ncbi:MAG: transposase [candidate division Zixibacteria bacterium]|nr:transposase [candidate division Zixibacteria bacterium]
MAEVVQNCDDQSLQNFLTNSPWCGRSVLDRIAQDVDDIFGDDPDTCLLVDESGILEEGNHFNWIGADGGYGKEPGFLRSLDSDGHIFVVDIHKDQRIYLELAFNCKA